MFKKARAAPTGDDAEVAIVDEYTCVYRTVNDLVAVVVGEGSENELLLEAALDAILSALELLLKKGVVKAQVSISGANAFHSGSRLLWPRRPGALPRARASTRDAPRVRPGAARLPPVRAAGVQVPASRALVH